MAFTDTTTAFDGNTGSLAAAVTSLEGVAFGLLKAFNTTSPHTQHVIVSDFVSASDVHAMPLTIGAATLATCIGAMSATMTTALHHGLDTPLSAAAENFEAAAADVLHALNDADLDTKRAVSHSYEYLVLPEMVELGPLFAIAALAIAVKNLTQTDAALGLRFEIWGGPNRGSPEHDPDHVGTAEEQAPR